MSSRSIDIGLLAAIGAAIGGLAVRAFGVHFWWLGVPVGMFAGYVIADWRGAVRAIPHAWRHARVWLRDRPQRPLFLPPRGWEAVRWVFYTACSIALTAALLSAAIDARFVRHEYTSYASLVLTWWASLLLVCAISSLGSLGRMRNGSEDPEEVIALAKQVVWWSSPPGACVGALWLLMVRIVPKIAQFAWLLLGFAIAFTRNLVLRIHSEERRVVAIASGLGTAIGYVANPHPAGVVVGMLVGALIGILEYAIAVAWFGVVPARSRNP